MVIACVLLFWNEGRAVARYKDLQESAGLVVNVDDISTLHSDMDGKLVHMTGEAVPDSDVQDSIFGVTTDGLKLRRNVQMYQWVEHKSQKTTKKTGGSSQTKTTYDYSTEWKDNLVNSGGFQYQGGHENPSTMMFDRSTMIPSSISFGAYVLSTGLINGISWFTPFESVSTAAIPQDSTAQGAQLVGNNFYFGNDPTYPTVGDTKVSFDYVPSGTISLMAVQEGASFSAYTTSRGGSVMFIKPGSVSAEDMLAQAEAENEFLTWILRLAGFGLMYCGFSSMLQPLITFADFIPLLGNILEGGVVPCLALVVTATLSSVVIAIAWIFYRPFFGIFLLLIAGGLSYFVYKRARQEQRANGSGPGFEMGKSQQIPQEEGAGFM